MEKKPADSKSVDNNPPQGFLQKSRHLIYLLEDGILVSLSLLLIGMAVAQIVLRNLFQSSNSWTEILIRVLVLWIGLFGAMAASRSGNHINIDLVTPFLPERSRIGIAVIVELFTTAVCGVVAWHCFRFVRDEFAGGMAAFAFGPLWGVGLPTKVPMWVCESILPLAFGVIGIRYLISAFINLNTFRKYP